MTIEKYLHEHYTANTAKIYQYEIENYMANYPQAAQAVYKDVVSYIGTLRTKYSKAPTLNRILCSIKAYYDFLCYTGQRSDNPARSIKLRDQRSRDIQLQDLFTMDELEALLNKPERYSNLAYRNQVLMGLLIYQALQPGEIEALTINDINLTLTPYQYASNSPVAMIDIDGMEGSIGISGSANVTQFQVSRIEFDADGDWIPDFDENFYKAWLMGMGAAAYLGTDIATGGLVSRTLMGYEIASSFPHNSSSTPEGRAAQDVESKHHLTNAFLFWGGGVIIGRAYKLIGLAASEVKYYFRGTIEGFEGGAGLQKAGITPTTSDPAVATMFATYAKKFGKGELQIAVPEELQGVKAYEPNVEALGPIEKEIPLGITPKAFAERTSLKISVDDARKILGDMGVKLPGQINTIDDLNRNLKEIPKLSQKQIDEFYNRAVKLKENK